MSNDYTMQFSVFESSQRSHNNQRRASLWLFVFKGHCSSMSLCASSVQGHYVEKITFDLFGKKLSKTTWIRGLLLVFFTAISAILTKCYFTCKCSVTAWARVGPGNCFDIEGHVFRAMWSNFEIYCLRYTLVIRHKNVTVFMKKRTNSEMQFPVGLA